MKYDIAKLLVVVAALLVLPVYAAVPGGATVSGLTDNGQYPVAAPGTIDVTAGNIYKANVSTEMSTYHWVGIYGNATGKLVLGDSSSNKMFEWDAQATYVFFDNDNTIDWDNLTATDCTGVEGEFTYLTGASDNCANTFTGTGDPGFKAIPDNVASTIQAQTYDDTGTNYWVTYALKDDTNGDTVFAAEVVATYHNAYDGTYSNYQVILPEDGSNGDTTPTTYYIWIELY